jgi:hypothetical protein
MDEARLQAYLNLIEAVAKLVLNDEELNNILQDKWGID